MDLHDAINSKAELNYIFINKKFINCIINCEACSPFERISSYHRTNWVTIHFSLRRNKKEAGQYLQYD